MPFRPSSLFRRRPEPTPRSTGGRLIYAVGDIHGRLDLFEPLLEQIHADAATSPPESKPVLVFLGDYVDRGAASKGVLDRIVALHQDQTFEVRALKGNHEEAMLAFLADPEFGPTWCEHGGAQTLASYGVTPPILRMNAEEWGKACDAFAAALPVAHLKLLTSLELTASIGDYLFVHAGVRPGVSLDDQEEHDLLWIRRDFLGADHGLDQVVVHGHTPGEEAYLGETRIGIDTGAYATGVLTAVRLEADTRRLIQARARRPT